MRTCALFSVALLAVLSFALPSQTSAQSFYLGAGGTFPTGDYSDFGDGDGADAGFMAFGGIDFDIGAEGLSVFGEGFFGMNDHDFEGDKTNLYGAMGGALYDFAPDADTGFYVFGQVGLMVHDYQSDEFSEFEDSETGLAFGGGGGYSFPLGGLNAFVEGRYMQGQFDDGNTSFLAAFAGVSFPFGGGMG